MNQADYLKLLEQIAQRAKKGDFELSDLMNRSKDYVNDSLVYRNMLEDAAGNEYLKNTGVKIPDLKRASSNDIERFVRDIIEENYGSDMGLNIKALKDKGYGSYTPSTNTLELNTEHIKSGRLNPQVTGDILHEAGHAYDKNSGLWKPSVNVSDLTKDKQRDIKSLGLTRDNAMLHDIDDIAEMIQKGHHNKIEGVRPNSFGRSALENLVNGRRLKQLAIPAAIGTAMIAGSGDASASESLMDEPSNISKFESGLRGAADNLSFGLADEAAGAVKNPVGAAKKALNYLGTDYNDSDVEDYIKERDESREAYRAAKKANPKSYATGEAVGMIAPMVATFGGSAGLTGAKALAAGVGMSAADSLGRSETDNTEKLLKDTAQGAAMGVAFPAVGKGIGKSTEALKGLYNLRKLH